MIGGQVSQAESINTDVDVTSVSFSRSSGGIGETVLDVRVPSGTWSKTTSRRAKYISAGYPQWLSNRQEGNNVLVAAGSYSGQADYYCDGVDDDVQIQLAIDSVYNNGGGTVRLTSGTFIVDNYINMKSNIILDGQGPGTVVKRKDSSHTGNIYCNGTSNCTISNMIFDGNSGSVTITSLDLAALVLCSAPGVCSFVNVGAWNYKLSRSTATTVYAAGFALCSPMTSCYSSGIECTNAGSGSAVAAGFDSCQQMTGCTSRNHISTANSATSISQPCGYIGCIDLWGCYAETLTANSSSGSKYEAGFHACSKVTSGYSNNSGTGSIGYGFCFSVSQCRSINNSSHYGTAGSQSYASSTADATFLCADTNLGGFNS
jgi:hypothetical protein